MNAIKVNEYSLAWREMASRFPKPSSILCISAHWETSGVRVLSATTPKTIHDFYGFPNELSAVQYAAPGSKELTGNVVRLLKDFSARPDPGWGLDHGSWCILRHMYPDVDIPVVQLSIDLSMPAETHFRIAQALRPLRQEGVLVLGSGNIVHNLSMLRFLDAPPFDWAVEFDRKVVMFLENGNDEALINYPKISKDAELAVPTPDHYLPLLYPLAIREKGESSHIFCRKAFGSLSMTSVAFGI